MYVQEMILMSSIRTYVAMYNVVHVHVRVALVVQYERVLMNEPVKIATCTCTFEVVVHVRVRVVVQYFRTFVQK